MIHKQLEELKEHVSLMARRAEAILDLALETLEKKEEALFQKTVAMDRELNAMEIQMDDKCMRLLALQEPFALDFRYIFSSIKTTRDLERIGDESKTIARWSLRLTGGQVSDDLQTLASKAREALKEAVQALIHSDLDASNRVLQLELEVDAIEEKILEVSTDISQALIVRALERIGDLATNIAENVIFSVKAKDIRHSS
ncbi:MAG: phosphate signaling complex protein PhoU [Leptospiraceae bacterium]|nr:phosphate signaling complex protein PhoU [Leptospiraceae bacterium]MCB1304319.1 phosphate signaling complex protein PhoU [Leptospiraceae bacterium]